MTLKSCLKGSRTVQSVPLKGANPRPRPEFLKDIDSASSRLSAKAFYFTKARPIKVENHSVVKRPESATRTHRSNLSQTDIPQKFYTVDKDDNEPEQFTFRSTRPFSAPRDETPAFGDLTFNADTARPVTAANPV